MAGGARGGPAGPARGGGRWRGVLRAGAGAGTGAGAAGTKPGPYSLLRGQEVVRGSDLARVELAREWRAAEGETAVVAFARSFG